jgi:hypothetical protein
MADMKALTDAVASLVASNQAEHDEMVVLLEKNNAAISRLLALIAAGSSIPQDVIDSIMAVSQENTDAVETMKSAAAQADVEGN